MAGVPKGSEPFYDPKEAGRRSGEVRSRRAKMTPTERAQDAISRQVPQLARELLDAALGRGDFEALSPAMRLRANMRALEWVLGRPASANEPIGDGKPEAEEDGFEVT